MSEKNPSETVKLKIGMQVNYNANSDYEDEVDTGIPWSKWNTMTEKERDEVGQGFTETLIANQVNTWAIPIED